MSRESTLDLIAQLQRAHDLPAFEIERLWPCRRCGVREHTPCVTRAGKPYMLGTAPAHHAPRIDAACAALNYSRPDAWADDIAHGDDWRAIRAELFRSPLFRRLGVVGRIDWSHP